MSKTIRYNQDSVSNTSKFKLASITFVCNSKLSATLSNRLTAKLQKGK